MTVLQGLEATAVFFQILRMLFNFSVGFLVKSIVLIDSSIRFFMELVMLTNPSIRIFKKAIMPIEMGSVAGIVLVDMLY
jgi:hypothetical protein